MRECFSMVKSNISSELEDFQTSKLNEFFLVADRIRKVSRNVRQGFRKFKSKTNPNDGDAHLPVLSGEESIPLTNESSFPAAAPTVLCLRASSFEPSDFPQGNSFSFGERRAIVTPEAQTAPNSSTRCSVHDRRAQATSERSDGGAREEHRQRSPPDLFLSDIPTQAPPGADEASGKFSPPQLVAEGPLAPATHDFGSKLTMPITPRSGSIHHQESSAFFEKKLTWRAACSNVEKQEHSSMKECRSVVNKIREAGLRHRREIVMLDFTERASHSNDGHNHTSTTPDNCTTLPREMSWRRTAGSNSKFPPFTGKQLHGCKCFSHLSVSRALENLRGGGPPPRVPSSFEIATTDFVRST